MKPCVKRRKSDIADAEAAARPTINAPWAHLAEYCGVAPIGVAYIGRLAAVVEGEGSGLPEAVPFDAGSQDCP